MNLRKITAILLTPLSFCLLSIYYVLSLNFNSIATNNTKIRTYFNQLFRRYHILSRGLTTYLLLLISGRSFGNSKFFNLSDSSIKELNSLIKKIYKEGTFHPRLGCSQIIKNNFKEDFIKSEFKYHQIISDGILINDSYPGFNISQRDLLSSPFLWRFLTTNDLEKQVLSVLGKKKQIYLTNLNAWMVTHLGSNNLDIDSKEILFSSSAQTYHYDFDLIHFCKLFINLTNTNINDGPFEFIDPSNSKDISNPPIVPKSVRGKKRFNNIPNILMDQQKFHTGPVGSSLVCPTFCIHRDGRPKRGNHRVVLQIEFATTLAFSEKNYGLENYNDILKKLYNLKDPSFMRFLHQKSYLLRHLNLFA